MGKEYAVELEEGMLVVAYPDKDQETSFGFKYWVGAKTPIERPWYEFEGIKGDTLFLILCFAGGTVLFLAICICFVCCALNKKNLAKVEVIEDMEIGNITEGDDTAV